MNSTNILGLSPEHLYQQALIYKNTQDYSKYAIYMTIAANYAYQPAIMYLEDDYTNLKVHLKQNYDETIDFYFQTQTYSYSAYYLGFLYEYGIYLQQDDEKAIKFYKSSVQQGNMSAIVNLGGMHYYGKGLPVNYILAREFFEIASKNNNSVGLCALAGIYYYGSGVNQDYHKARNLYELSMYKGNCDAMLNLGNMYSLGRGLPKNKDKAKELYLQAGEKGNRMAYFNLGTIYENEKNYLLAIKYYELSNNHNAKNNLGLLYQYGKGVPIDLDRAREYFLLSSQGNNLNALKNLEYLDRKTEESSYLDNLKHIFSFRKTPSMHSYTRIQ